MSPDFEKRFVQLENKINDIQLTVHKILQLCSPAPREQELDAVLSVKEVADMIGVQESVIYTKCANGHIPFERLGRKYRFKRSEIIAWWGNQQNDPEVSIDKYVANYLQKNALRG